MWVWLRVWLGHAHRGWGRRGVGVHVEVAFEQDVKLGDRHPGEEESVRLVRCAPAPDYEQRVQREPVADVEAACGEQDDVQRHAAVELGRHGPQVCVVFAVLGEVELRRGIHETFGGAQDVPELFPECGEDGRRGFEHADLIAVPVAVVFEDGVGFVEDADADGEEIDEE